jgi:hypothetical protein
MSAVSYCYCFCCCVAVDRDRRRWVSVALSHKLEMDPSQFTHTVLYLLANLNSEILIASNLPIYISFFSILRLCNLG